MSASANVTAQAMLPCFLPAGALLSYTRIFREGYLAARAPQTCPDHAPTFRPAARERNQQGNVKDVHCPTIDSGGVGRGKESDSGAAGRLRTLEPTGGDGCMLPAFALVPAGTWSREVVLRWQPAKLELSNGIDCDTYT